VRERVGTYSGTSHLRKGTPLEPYRTPVPRVLGGSQGSGRFLMGEVPLYNSTQRSSWPAPVHIPEREGEEGRQGERKREEEGNCESEQVRQ